MSIEYPELKYIDAELLDEWKSKLGPNPEDWSMEILVHIQLAKNIRELTTALKQYADSPLRHGDTEKGNIMASPID